MTLAPQPVRDRIADMCRLLEDMYVSYWLEHGNVMPAPTFTAEYGRSMVRIVVNTPSSRSVYCFVDMKSGDILKAASWKAPAKGPRGSIWNEGCDVGIDKPCNIFGSGLYVR